MSSVFVFDAYGTLFDVHSAVTRHADTIGPGAAEVSALWRARQLEYSWVHGLSRHYTDFWTLTRRSLRHALAVHGLDGRPELENALLGAYESLDAYPEVAEVLAGLKKRGATTAILSNATPGMLGKAVAAAGLGDHIDEILSVDDIQAYKPDPPVYALVTHRLEVAATEVAFQSSNAWDVAGAAACGLTAHWINRTGAPAEYPEFLPRAEYSDLRPLLNDVGPP